MAFALLDKPEAFQAMVDLINAQYGLSLTADDVAEMGKKVLKTERQFNREAGFTERDDQLPEFFSEEVPPHNATWDFTSKELQEGFAF